MTKNWTISLVLLLFSIGNASKTNAQSPVSPGGPTLDVLVPESAFPHPDIAIEDTTCCEAPQCETPQCGCCCNDRHGFLAGVEATYLRPSPEERDAGFLFGDTFFSLGEFDYAYEAAPRVWVQWQNECGLGIRSRYWQLDAEADPIVDISINPSQLNPSVALNQAHSELELYTIDLEATQRFSYAWWCFEGSFGARHASIAHDYVSKSSTMGNEVSSITEQAISRRFDGTGLTASLEATRPICDCHISLFVNIRGSALWGESKSRFFDVNATQDLGTITNFSQNDIEEEDTDTLLIGEGQLGIEWAHPVSCCGGAVVFVRAMVEGQLWSLRDNGIGGIEHPADSLAEGDVGFYGMAFSVGAVR